MKHILSEHSSVSVSDLNKVYTNVNTNNSTWPERLGWQSQRNDDDDDGEKQTVTQKQCTKLFGRSKADTGERQYPLSAPSVRGPQLNQ